MQQLRITLTAEVREALATLKSQRYPLLSQAEIVKVVLSEKLLITNKTDTLARKQGLKDLRRASKALGQKWLQAQGQLKSKLSEDELYEMVKNA